MTDSNEHLTSHGSIKYKKMVQEREIYSSIQRHQPFYNEEIIYFVSRCLEIKKRESLIMRELLQTKEH